MKRRFLILAVLLTAGLSYAQQNLTVGEVVAAALQKNYDVQLQRNTAATAYSDRKYTGTGVFLPQVNASGAIVKNTTDSRSVTASDVETVRKGIKSTNTQGSVQLVWTFLTAQKCLPRASDWWKQ